MEYADYDLDKPANPVRKEQVESSWAWTRHDINPRDCIVKLQDEDKSELAAMVEAMAANPLPIVLRHPDQFEIPALRQTMAKARSLLDDGPGVAIIDRLPMDELETETSTAIAWVLGHLIGRPVAQKWDGTMLYDVKDTGARYGYGVRGSYTNVELVFHTDNAFSAAPPEYVGLLCYHPALEGGLSRFCSLYTVHNLMLKRYPSELARLYEPLLWDRQAEHAEGAPKVARAPMFRWEDGRLKVRANVSLNQKGYDVAGDEMDEKTRSALQALTTVTADEDLWFELPIERGQIQYLNNSEVAHYRSEFTDHSDPELKRHLVRTWHRNAGQQTFDG